MKLGKALSYVSGFVVARGALFIAPILLANLLTLDSYGAIERAQAIAALTALIVGFGLPASVPLILLRPEVSARWDTLLLIVLTVSALAFVVAIGAFMINQRGLSPGVLIPVSVGMLLLQSTWSGALKAKGRLNTALFLEAGFWFFTAIGAVVSILLAMSDDWIVLWLWLYASALWAVALRAYKRGRSPFKFADVQENIQLGVPLLTATIFTLLATSSGRYVLAFTADAETVGVYSVLYRATALPIVGHQILTVAFFRQIYTWNIDDLKRRSPLIPVGVFGFVVSFWVLADPLGWMLGAKFEELFVQFRFVGLIILSQTILWSAISLNDMVNARIQITAAVARLSFPILLAGMSLLFATVLISEPESLQRNLVMVTVGQSLLMGVYYLFQCFSMVSKGGVFWRLWSTVGATYSLILLSIIGSAESFESLIV